MDKKSPDFSKIIFKKEKNIKSDFFEQAMYIYNESFPDYERHSVEKIKKRVSDEISELYVCSFEKNVLAFCLIFKLNDKIYLLDYFAVHHNVRNKGVGKLFFEFLKKEFKNKILILEVENPEFGENKEIKEKRVEFYLKNGAKILENVRYLLPPIEKDSEPVEMILMIFKNDTNYPIFSTTDIKKTIIEIYKSVYGRNEDDKVLKSFIDSF